MRFLATRKLLFHSKKINEALPLEITRAGALFYKYSGMTREGLLKERKDLYNRKKEIQKD